MYLIVRTAYFNYPPNAGFTDIATVSAFSVQTLKTLQIGTLGSEMLHQNFGRLVQQLS